MNKGPNNQEHRKRTARKPLFSRLRAALGLMANEEGKGAWLPLVLVALMVLVPLTAFANLPGLVIPSGSRVNVNGGTFDIAGTITIEGTLSTMTGTIGMTRDWVNATGFYDAQMGTVAFTGTAGTQFLDSSGTGSGKRFYNLAHTGTSTVLTQNNDLDIDNDFLNLNGTFDANSLDMTVAGDWTNYATFIAGSNTVTLDGTMQAINGSTTFNNFTKTVTVADTLTFENTGTQTITGTLTMHGTMGQLLTLDSDDGSNQFGITLNAGGFQVLSYLAVANSDASAGLTLVAGSTSTDLGNTDNWVFGGAVVTWDGDTDTNWFVASNWDLGFVPGPDDTAVIPGAPSNQPSLTADADVTNLTLQDTASTLTLGGNGLTVSGTLSNTGTITLFGDETVSINNEDTDSGTFIFLGNGDGSSDTHTITDIETSFFNLIINDTNPTVDSFQTNANLNVFGTLSLPTTSLDVSTNGNTLTTAGTISISGGSLLATSGNIDANGGLSITSGTLSAPTSGQSFTLAGDFEHTTAGTFIANTGTLTLDGADQQVLGDQNTTFYAFSKKVTTMQTLTFTTSSTQTFTGTLQMTGTMGNLLFIDSDSPGVQAPIRLLAMGIQDLQYLSVRDSDASGGLLLVARNSVESPASSTTNWAFGGTTITWDGSEDTNWNNPANWDLGVVPTTGDTAIIPSAPSNQPVLTAAGAATNVTIASGASVTLNGNALTISGTLSNDGTVNLFGDEGMTITNPDTDSGTFNFVGNGDGSTDNILISTITGTFFNVTINDMNATMDNFLTSGTFAVNGSLNVVSSTFDVSTNSSTLVVGGTLQVSGGSLLATSGTIDANGNVNLTSGTLTAPGSSGNFTVAGDWTRLVTGTFIHSSGQVELDTTTTATITGDTRFYDFFSRASGKTVLFTDGSNQTIENDFDFVGSSGTEIVLRSTGGGSFDQTFPNGPQVVQFIDVEDATAVTNSVTCFNCIDNDPGSTTNWIFAVLSIDVPATGETTDTTPTVIGVAAPGATVEVRDSGGMVRGTVVSDSNGNFRFEIAGTLALTPGAETLTPFVGGVPGGGTSITVSAAPTTAQQPTIITPPDGSTIIDTLFTITGAGEAGSAVVIQASDEDGNLPLTTLGTGTVALDGTYSVTLTTPPVRGVNFFSATVSGVASDIFEYTLVDPFGVVFNSLSGEPLENATVTLINDDTGLPAQPGVELAATDVNPVVTGTNGQFAFLAVDGNYRFEVERDNFTYPSQLTSFPAGRVVTTGSKGEVFVLNYVILEIDQPMDPDSSFLRIEKDANKKEVKIGEVVTYTITIENISDLNLDDVLLRDQIPPGFKYIDGRVTLDGVPISDPSGARPVIFTLGNIASGQKMTLKYQLVVGSGVTVGNYDNVAYATHESGLVLSNVATETVTVILDPLFDLGTTIGKVFYDRNENGVQDPPYFDPQTREMVTESPVPNVRIAMEDGTVITTDKNGRYSVPALTPGRHLFRLDERTLPEGTYLTTDKVVVVDVTPGLLIKANFGVNFHDGDYSSEDDRFFAETVKVTLETDKPKPRLHASLFGNEIAVANGVFIEKAEFRIFTNYAPFIEKWRLEILDADTKEIVQVFEGDRLNIHDPILWGGRDVNGEYILFDRKYEFRVYAEDKEGKFDETRPVPIKFKEIKDDIALAEYKAKVKEMREEYDKWVRQEKAKDSLLVQTILVDGETVKIDRLKSRLQSVRVMKGGELVTEIPIGRQRVSTAKDMLEQKGPVKLDQLEPLEVILPVGDYQILVQDDLAEGEEAYAEALPATPEALQEFYEGQAQPVKTYSKPVKVGDDQLFFVAMGDGKIGYTFTRGNIEPVQHDDKFKGGFYSQGKAAYYLQGKILGKYLIESSFDTERDRKEIFRNLDEDEYYPIYGDESTIDYKATNTQGNLYALIEWDKSSVLWGNYSVGFDDTEFARFSRSLYGGKVDFETLSTTKYGDPRSKVVAFRARAQQKSAHNEFLGTGGSLYFLKHKDIIEGSDKIKIEVRDKITGLVLSESTMVEGADYEIDYGSGRVVFWQPVRSIVESYSIISSELLDGNLVYVVADYEYDVKDKFDEDNVGTRVKQAIGENVVVGGTYVRENLETSDYQLKGTDVTVKLGDEKEGTYATFVAEYAESESEQQPAFVSTDGGLSFTELGTDDSAQGRAYGLKGNAILFNRLALKSYYRWVENDFSTSATTAQQGKEITGFEAIYDVTDSTRFTLRHDIQELVDDGNLQTQTQVGSNKTTVTMAQIVHQARKLKITGEYQRRTDEAADTASDIVAVRADYTLSDRIKLALEQQYSITGEDEDYKTTIGVEAKPTDKITLRAQETIGEDGSATTVGATVDVHEKLALSGDYSFLRPRDGEATSKGEIGAIAKINDRVKLHTTLGVSEEGLTRSTSWELGGDQEISLIGGTKIGADASVDSTGQRTTVLTVGGTMDVTDDTSVDSNVTITDNTGVRSTTVSVGGVKDLGDDSQVDSIITVTDQGGARSTTVTVGGVKKLSEFTEVESKLSVTGAQDTSATTVSFGGKSQLDESTEVDTSVSVSDSVQSTSTTFSVGGKQQVDENTQVENRLSFTDSTTGVDTASLTFGSRKHLAEDLDLVTARSLSRSADGQSSESKYSLSKVKDDAKLEGTFTRKYSEGESEVSQSNIFGLTGEIDDRWAATGSYERATVKNLDGSETQRDALAFVGGYVRKNPDTGLEELKSSTKVEVRFDKGDQDKRQYLVSSSTEGQLTPGLGVYGKIEMSSTRNTSLDFTEADHKEFIIGGAYRPLMHDDLNLLARYTYLEEKSPAGQVDSADIEEERSHVIAAEAVYDLTERWQISEKFAYRISDEKVAGFDFTKTHTWLMIHRLNYKITRDWAVGGEFRVLTQREAKDRKRGVLIEATRRLGEYAQLGVGYDFTDFSDDLTNLDYTTQGPFLRITGKLYDRTPEEIERARQEWIEEKVMRWAWMMVTEELSRDDSPILEELNDYFSMAEAAYDRGDYEESKRIYKDIIIAGQMMFEEAAEYIRAQIAREERLKELQDLADQYYKNGQFEKAKKILQKILEEAERDVLKSSKSNK